MDIDQLKWRLMLAERAARKAMDARVKLSAGPIRPEVTTANLALLSAREYRDHLAEQVRSLEAVQ